MPATPGPVRTVALEEIDGTDRSLRFSSDAGYERLRSSIEAVGVLHPVLLRPQDGRLQIVSGFKRYRAACHLGLETMGARVFDPGSPPLDAFRVALRETLALRDLNTVEVARVLRILRRLGLGDGAIAREFLPLIGIGPAPHLVPEYLRVLDQHPSAQAYIERFGLALREALNLFGLEHPDQEVILEMAEALRMKSHELSSLLELLREIAGRDGCRPRDVLDRIGLGDVLRQGRAPRSARVDRIRRALREIRYPELSRIQGEIRSATRRLDLPSGLRVSFDPTLEKPGLELRAEIREVGSIEGIVSALGKPENLEILRRILSRW